MQRKGVTPLVATVMIIGFSVVVAALLINWSDIFVEDIRDDTGASLSLQVVCNQDIDFKLSEVCIMNNRLHFILANDGSVELSEISVKVTGTNGEIKNIKFDNIPPYTMKRFISKTFSEIFSSQSAAVTVSLIEVTPSVFIGDESRVCTDVSQSFGKDERISLPGC
ncbi:MAG: hypothetical protein AABW49_03690 [Nanoarchaeota archaeon]